MFEETDDRETIRRILRGEAQLFSKLVERYKAFVFTIAWRYTNNREDAEEIAQDVFVKAYRSLADFRSDSKFSTWLFSITRNTCSTFSRKRKLETTSLSNENVFEHAAIQDASDNDTGIERSKAAVLNKAIGLLHTEDATVITLFYKGEQSLEEIGQILGITANNARVKLHRARQRLREIIERHFANELKEINC